MLVTVVVAAWVAAWTIYCSRCSLNSKVAEGVAEVVVDSISVNVGTQFCVYIEYNHDHYSH